MIIRINRFGLIIAILKYSMFCFRRTGNIWFISIPYLFSISNCNTVQKGAILFFTKEKRVFDFTFSWAENTIYINYKWLLLDINFNLTESLFGKKRQTCTLGESKSFKAKDGLFTIYKCTGYSFYSRLPFLKYGKYRGWTYSLVLADGSGTMDNTDSCIFQEAGNDYLTFDQALEICIKGQYNATQIVNEIHGSLTSTAKDKEE